MRNDDLPGCSDLIEQYGLNEKQARFVLAYASRGDGNATQAAVDAGYASGDAAKVQGHRCLHHPQVRKALQDVGRDQLNGLAGIAIRRLRETLLDPECPRRELLTACKLVLDKALPDEDEPQAASINKPLGEMTRAELEQFVLQETSKDELMALLVGKEAKQ
ncbi:MAG: terminase small subunit [Desulfovibrionaceae bacterium]